MYVIRIEHICQEIKMIINNNFSGIRSNKMLKIMKFYHTDPCLRK